MHRIKKIYIILLWIMKKVIGYIALIVILLSHTPTYATTKRMVRFPWQQIDRESIKNNVKYTEDGLVNDCQQKKFKITAYYMPLENQGIFLHWGYEEDVSINGGNATSASGKPVFFGTVAAPKSYPYNTIIHIPWLGYGSVEDRWWAIVSSWGVDYIDIRVWKGLEWLNNAMQRWVRWLSGYVCPPNSIESSKIWRDISNFVNKPLNIEDMMWKVALEHWQTWILVSKLQSRLWLLWYLKDYKDGIFWHTTKQAVCNFQQENINLPADDQFCWYYGVRTRAKMVQIMLR